MPELPQKKVGIVACSGEELAEGTVTPPGGTQGIGKNAPRRHGHHLSAALSGRR